MIFADKLIGLRKKAGWSQEELAERMQVTRQSVSKWESAQSVPDLEKMVRLSELFGVSTDYLLKTGIESAEDSMPSDKASACRRVSMEEADAFLTAKVRTAKSIALATFLCILSPICLLLLGAISEVPEYGLTENTAGGIGMIVMLVFVAIAVAIFISSGSKTASFAYLEKEVFETERGVYDMIAEQKTQYHGTYTRNNIIGACFCIMALIPLFAGVIINDQNDLLMVGMLSVSFLLAGVGVFFFIRTGVIWESYEKLLQEGGYTREKKENHTAAISTVYWPIATAIYLGYSLVSNDWGYSWIIWVVAGVAYPAVIGLVHLVSGKKK